MNALIITIITLVVFVLVLFAEKRMTQDDVTNID